MSSKDKQSMARLNYFIFDTKCNAIKVAPETTEKADVLNSVINEKITPYNIYEIKRSITTIARDASKK